MCHVHVLVIDSDGGGDPGLIEQAFQVGTTDGAGFVVDSPSLANRPSLNNGTKTLLLVTGSTGVAVGLDLDTNDDGILDVTPWTSVSTMWQWRTLKAMTSSLLGRGAGPGFDGISTYEPGGASRVPNGTDTDSVGDWKRNDFDGEGLPGFGGGTVDPGEAASTPELLRPGTSLPPPVIDEIVLDHVGVDSEERIEICGEPSLPYPRSRSWSSTATAVAILVSSNRRFRWERQMELVCGRLHPLLQKPAREFLEDRAPGGRLLWGRKRRSRQRR